LRNDAKDALRREPDIKHKKTHTSKVQVDKSGERKKARYQWVTILRFGPL
jgi:hypothetical protein